MNNNCDNILLEETVLGLLREIGAESISFEIYPIDGDFYNSTYIVAAHSASGGRTCIVIKCYAECGVELGEKARLEFKTLTWLSAHDIPVPKPLYLDEGSGLLQTPSLVTSYVPGEQYLSSEDTLSCARALAKMLAKIHSIPCDEEARHFLLDANKGVLWFLNRSAMPDYMRTHPDGEFVWKTL